MRVLATWLVAMLACGCGQTVRGAPPWDANVDAPRGDAGVIYGTRPRTPSSGGTTRTEPGCFAQLLVIFDRSGSMATEWSSGDVHGPRWQIAADALTTAITPIEDRLQVGAILFPSSSDVRIGGECTLVDPIESQLDYREGPDFVDAWEALWSSPALIGSTPLDSAFDAANDALDDAHDPTAVVVLTDGEPTCMGRTPAEQHAANWRARGIRTWVVGLPGASGSTVLEAIAIAGGTGASISAADPAALTAGLTEILGEQVEQACGD